MLKKLLGILFSHPQVGPQLVQRLSETWPIRRAARFTAYLYFKGKLAVEDGLKKQVTQQSFGAPDKQFNFTRFKQKFQEELRKGVQEARDDIKRRQN